MKNGFIIMMFIIASLCSIAQIPKTVSIQGQLWKANGEPLDDGTYDFTVNLYDASSGGTAIEVCNPCTATTQRGVFALTIGGAGQPALPPMDKPYWVAISLAGEELQPRLPFHSVPYALNSLGAVPVGSILPFAGSERAVPSGWLVCDGRALVSTSYPRLLETVGRMWGDGSSDNNPETDFNLPDLRGMFLRGADMGADVDKQVYERQPVSATDIDASGVATVQGTVEGFSAGEYERQRRTFTVDESPPQIRVANVSVEVLQSYTPNAAVLYIIRVR